MKAGWLEERVERIASVAGYLMPAQLEGADKLDSNENYAIPGKFQDDVVRSAQRGTDVRQYPLGGTERLMAAISAYVGLPQSMIGVGSGSDQILDLLLSHFATKKTRVLTSDPTFSFFEHRCRLYSIPTITVPFSGGMTLDSGELEKKAERADILYLDSPNNPTGFQFPKADLQRIIRSFDGLVIIDEAYGEFGDYSVAAMARTHKNLVVTRTLSKSFGLAGLRLGYMVAGRQIAKLFRDVLQYPYPLSTITIESGIEAMKRSKTVDNAAGLVRSERERIIKTLRGYGVFDVFDSKGNFVLFDAGRSYKRVHAALAEQGISIRNLGRIGAHKGCLRVTVGTRKMNSRFLLAVRDLLL